MGAFTVRAMMEDDLSAMEILARRGLPLETIPPGLIHEKTLQDPHFYPRASFVALNGERLIGAAPAAVMTTSERKGYIKFLVVDPEYRRRGAASSLLQSVEDVLRADGVAAVRLLDEPANYLTPGVDARYTAAFCLLERRGYARVGETINMEVDLRSLPRDGKAMLEQASRHGIRVERAHADDKPAVMAFLRQYWAGWQYEVGNTFDNTPISTFLARDVRTDAIVGFASYEGNNRGLGSFGPMGTAPDYRGRGIGAACCLLCLLALRELGHRRAVIPWVGPVGFYGRQFGAEIERVFWTWEKRLQAD